VPQATGIVLLVVVTPFIWLASLVGAVGRASCARLNVDV
jgi:hypothetical protein